MAVLQQQKRSDPPRENAPPLQSETRSQATMDAPGVTELNAGANVLSAEANPKEQRYGSLAPGVQAGGGQGKNAAVVAQPDYGVNPKPPYPMLARRLGAQGVVLLRVYVREDGSVANVELARSSGFSLLDESATRTVRESWRFVPARIDNAPIASWVEVPIRFVLADS